MLALASPSAPIAPPASLLDLVRAETSRKSLRTYATGWAHFAAWQGSSPEACAQALLGAGRAAAVRLVYRYRQTMLDNGCAPRSINVRLAALRYLVTTAERLGIIDWQLPIKGVPVRAFRDTRGPRREEWLAIRAACESLAHTRTGARDLAILRLLYDLGLRRGEVASLDVRSYDIVRKCLTIRGKARHEDETISVPAETAAVLEGWIRARGGESSAPMFIGLDKAHAGENRIDAGSIARIVQNYAMRAGLENVTPHALRHSAITYVSEQTNGNRIVTQKFARHLHSTTTDAYIDQFEDVAGKAAAMLAK